MSGIIIEFWALWNFSKSIKISYEFVNNQLITSIIFPPTDQSIFSNNKNYNDGKLLHCFSCFLNTAKRMLDFFNFSLIKHQSDIWILVYTWNHYTKLNRNEHAKFVNIQHLFPNLLNHLWLYCFIMLS